LHRLANGLMMIRRLSEAPSEESCMNLKLVVAISVLTAMPAFGQAPKGAPQKGAPAADVPKPTMADVQKVVQTISGDKAKMQAYCDLSKLDQQMANLDDKKDAATLEDLGKKADDLAQKLGPDYIKVVDGLDQVDEKSSEAKEFGAALGALDKQCK
jgi:hypothetical protein